MAMKFVSLTLLLLLLSAAVFARRDEGRSESRERDRDRERGDRRRRGDESFDDLKPRKPREIFRSDGGRIEAYSPEDYQALCEAEFGVKRVTVEPNGLVLPCYKDSHVMLAVMEGRVRAGIVSPFADKVTERSVFELQGGDVLAIPRGFSAWVYNDGNERAQFIDFADTTTSNQCGCFQSFHLAGSSEEQSSGRSRSEQQQQQQDTGRSLLHGFSKQLLAHAWGVDESMVQRLLEGQKGSVIIKVEEQRRKDLPAVTNNGIYMNYVYRFAESQPDVSVRNGGELRQLNSMKLPILKHLGLSATCYKLRPGALSAPSWTHNGHSLVYAHKGRGRVEVVRENGEQAVQADMEEGMIMVIPANFPSAKMSGDEGFEYGVIYKSPMPVESFLAGRNSVYKGIPSSVIASSLQIDEKLQQKLEERRTEEAYIFPARESRSRKEERGDSFHFVENLVRVFG